MFTHPYGRDTSDRIGVHWCGAPIIDMSKMEVGIMRQPTSGAELLLVRVKRNKETYTNKATGHQTFCACIGTGNAHATQNQTCRSLRGFPPADLLELLLLWQPSHCRLWRFVRSAMSRINHPYACTKGVGNAQRIANMTPSNGAEAHLIAITARPRFSWKPSWLQGGHLGFS